MRAIDKGPEPKALPAYRAVPGATYDGKDFTPVKDAIRDAILRDQFHLCCYCLRRISSETQPHPTKPDVPAVVKIKIEHWQSQDAFPHLQLVWSNLLGACLGGQGSPWSAQTCDTRKGEAAITLNPLDPKHIAMLYCTSSGRLESKNSTFQQDIDVRLGLNHTILVRERKTMLDRALEHLKHRYPTSGFPVGKVKNLIHELETPTDGKLPEFCNVLRLWAQKRFGELV